MVFSVHVLAPYQSGYFVGIQIINVPKFKLFSGCSSPPWLTTGKMSGSGVDDLEYPGRYIFDHLFPKSSLDSLRHLHRLRADLFEKIVFLEKEEVVGDDTPAVANSGDLSS